MASALFIIFAFTTVVLNKALGDLHETKITASDGANGEGFGRSVYISGDYVIVGASGTGNDLSRIPSAYIYDLNYEFPWELFYPAFLKKKNN